MASSLSDLASKLEDLDEEIHDEVEDEVESNLEAMRVEAQQNLSRQGAIATGRLAESLEVDSTPHSDTSSTHSLGSSLEYAKYVEYGTGSGNRYPAPDSVPHDELITWMASKPVIPREYDTYYELAPAIEHSIVHGSDDSPPGTPEQEFLRRAWKGRKEWIKRDVRSAVKRAVKNTVR